MALSFCQRAVGSFRKVVDRHVWRGNSVVDGYSRDFIHAHTEQRASTLYQVFHQPETRRTLAGGTSSAVSGMERT